MWKGTRPVDTHVLEVPIYPDDNPPIILGNPDPVPIGTYTPATPLDRFEFNTPRDPNDAHRAFLARHEFGDTRHRHVTYRLVATTRFKEYFPKSITDDPTKLIRTATFEVDVPNTVEPPALEITSIVPAFQWDRPLDGSSSTARGRMAARLSRSQVVRDRRRRGAGGRRRASRRPAPIRYMRPGRPIIWSSSRPRRPR